MPPQPRPEVQSLSGVVHGAFDFAELERLNLHPDEVLDFSVNSNPYGPPPSVFKALAGVRLDRYPDSESLALRRALSVRLGLPVIQILPGNGTAELLWLIALAFLSPGDLVLVIGPTFGEYSHVAKMMGAGVHSWSSSPEENFQLDPDAIDLLLSRTSYRVVFLCNPNNPTGQVLPTDRLDRWARTNPLTLFVIDEAYFSFARGFDSAIRLGFPNLLVLRSMTKDYALAGLRLGYALGSPALIESLAKVRPPWNVNALAQVAGLTALEEEAYLRRCMADLQRAHAELEAGIKALGYPVVPSAVHFFLASVGDGAAFRAGLLRRGLLVRDCASFGLPAYVRIATRQPEENRRLLLGIKEMEE